MQEHPNADVPSHYRTVHHGFWPSGRRSLLAVAHSALPSASDRYLESAFFAELALSIPPNKEQLPRINWYVSAHMAAYIGIFDATKHDVKRLHPHVKFEDTPVFKEMKASPQNEDFK